MADVTKEEALQAITTVYRYALSLGNSHPMARDISVWMVRQWNLSGTMAVQAVQREKNANAKSAKAAPVNTTDQPGRVKFVHPKSPQAQAVEPEPTPAFQSPLQPETAQSGEGQDSQQRRGRKQKHKTEQPETAQPQEGEESPVVAADPLNSAELSEVKGMGIREILHTFGEARLTATLEILEIEHAELSGSQKAAAVKANAGK
jgi:hypothetical protein